MMLLRNTDALPEGHMLRTRDLDYDLPRELIATAPAEPRDSARLLVVRGQDRLEHAVFRDLPGFLAADDRVVVNTSRVIPARLLGRREDTGGQAEGLFLEFGDEPGLWVCMVKARRFKPSARIALFDQNGAPSPHAIELVDRHPGVPGAWIVRLVGGPWEDAWQFKMHSMAVISEVGHVPLPPYIRSARRDDGQDDERTEDLERYQTVYADPAEAGSVAAPTAGLHFTPTVLEALAGRGVVRRDVTLHVGAGTFREVETELVEDHDMHHELCHAPASVMDDLHTARQGGHRVVAVGTTAARTIEAGADGPGGWFETNLLITPGYRWKLASALITNFHLPRSTLMAMVAALLPGGVEQLQDVYAQAIEARYRFYSYGDAMLVLP
ncbi:MAG: tRNA preQ1(34) S-adenosylmethionine ribosyltransferase-isomerase QueA [Phycisphaerales bacterium]|jgi:S-adenosylmethionine:tRNA ribosyltransferase-isomerase